MGTHAKMKSTEALYELLYTIRHFETRLLELFSLGKLNGTTHAYIGQEANATGLIPHLSADDIVWSNHRCHGHYIAHTGDVEGLVHELVGTSKGTCAGKGGSQHLCKGNFYTNGIQGSIVPVAAGMALAEKFKKSGAIAVVFIGDGTLGEGAVYETLNLAALWKLPILFVLENNTYAQSTPSSLQIAGTIRGRAEAFGLPVFETNSNDMLEIHQQTAEVVEHVRNSRGPAFLIMHTYRTCPHSKGDDFRDTAEIEAWRAKDPLQFARKHLSPERYAEIERRVSTRVEAAIEQALAMVAQPAGGTA